MTKFIRIILFIAGLILLGECSASVTMQAQEKDSRGKDFWFTFIPNLHVNNPSTDSLFVYIAAEEPTNGTLRYKGRNGTWQTIQFSISNPAQVFSHKVHWLPYELQGENASGGQSASNNQVEKPVENVFHVTSDKEVTVYALNQGSTTSDAFLVLPTDALGKDHYVLTYNSDRQGNVFSQNSSTPSEFAIVATEDNTDVTIFPSAPTSRIASAAPIITNLNQGESFLVQAEMNIGDGSGDMTGTRIQATKPIGLFAGQQRARIPIKNDELTSRDHIVEQIPSVDTWGRMAIVIPFPKPYNATNISQDIYRVLAAYDSTDIMINGIKTTTLSKGGIYQSVLTTPQVISSNKSILVAQYKKTSGSQNSSTTDYNGDPFMMLVPPSDQFQDNYRFVSIQAVNFANGFLFGQGYEEQWITVVMPNTAVANTKLDGQLIGTFPGFGVTAIPGTNYSYIWLRVIDGVHSVTSDERVGIYVYGYGRANSYGYVGGMSFRSFDFNPPQITGKQDCSGYQGMIYDTVAGDSRIVQVLEEPGTAKNIKSFTYNFTPPQDSVMFKVALQDPYQDGAITVTALDSVQQKTTVRIGVKGFTVSSSYKLVHNDSVQDFSEKTPVGKKICYDITLENYGGFDQVIIPTLKKGAGSTFSIVGPPSLTLKPKQTFTYQICNNATIEGSYVDSLFIDNACSERAIATFSLTAYLDKDQPIVTTTIDSCGTCHVLFIADSGATDGGLKQVVVSSAVNVQWQNQAPQTDAFRILSICVQDVYKDAFYRVMAEDKNGNVTTYSDTIPGFTVTSSSSNGKVKQLGGKPIGTLYCDTITLFNAGLYEQIINEVRLSKNTTFSVPRASFPLRIPSGATVNVLACYAPTEIIDTLYDIKRDRDTIFLGRNCVSLPFAYEAFGVEDTLIANGKCEVKVKSSIIDLSLTRISHIGIAPHPVTHGSMQSQLSFSINAQSRLGITIIEPITGKSEQLFAWETAPIGEYAVGMDLQSWAPGTYMLLIESDNEREIIPFLIAD
ncbi:MAG: IgGFc-binding protein [Ignavibacteria bacterium]